MLDRKFNCPDCETGIVSPRRIPGRVCLVRYPDLRVFVPTNIELETCDVCLSYSVHDDQEDMFEKAIQSKLILGKKKC